MLCQRFAESWFNRKHIVAGRKLRPFCLWHFTYLDFINSPLSIGAGPSRTGGLQDNAPPINFADTEEAARVCQLRYLQMLPGIPKWRLKLHLFRTLARTTEEREQAAFYDYINDYFNAPQFNQWRAAAGYKRGGPPDPLSVASAVIMMFGGGERTERFVWEMPIGKAYWYASTLHYNRGEPVDYMTAKDEAFRRFLREQRRKGLI